MAARVSSPDLVGRTGELADLEHALEQASAGEAGIVLVSGDAGVGKSRLVAEVRKPRRPRIHLKIRRGWLRARRPAAASR